MFKVIKIEMWVNREEIESRFEEFFGTKRVLWLKLWLFGWR